MIIIVFIALVFVFAAFPKIRCAVFHPVSTCYYAGLDLYHYIHDRKYNIYRTGELVAYVGLFGKGKTLSAVHKVVSAYRKYNGLPVWCSRRKRIVTQRIHIISEKASDYSIVVFIASFFPCSI